MKIQQYALLVMIIALWLPLKAAYEPRRYREFIKEALQRLNDSRQLNEEKIRSLERNREYVLKKEQQQRRSPGFRRQLVSVIEGNDAALNGLRAETRLIQEQMDKLTRRLSPAQLLLLTDQKGEEQAVKQAEQEILVDTLQRNAARAQFAQTFFERQAKFNEPQASRDLASLQENWKKRKSILNTQLTQAQAALRPRA
ncbi:hypothetical protein H0W26_01995 [Candidatus Dependentiae bacterium]|nr:hypothetical protein [Candidatus Dependentiae bacterium]